MYNYSPYQQQPQADQYQPFQSRTNPRAQQGQEMGQLVKAAKGGKAAYDAYNAGTAGQAAAGGTASGASSLGGKVLGGLNMAKDAYGVGQGMQMQQGVAGRDQGTFAGSMASAGQGAAAGSQFGPVGTIIGAALGNESYQWQHGNREALTSPGKLLKSELTGGLAARDIGRWTGLWS